MKNQKAKKTLEVLILLRRNPIALLLKIRQKEVQMRALPALQNVPAAILLLQAVVQIVVVVQEVLAAILPLQVVAQVVVVVQEVPKVAEAPVAVQEVPVLMRISLEAGGSYEIN